MHDARSGWALAYLDETDVGGLLPEALTADVKAVLADQTSGVGADAAVGALAIVQKTSYSPSPRALQQRCNNTSSSAARRRQL